VADKSKANLDKAPPLPPELQTRPGIADLVASRDEAQNGPSVPGKPGAPPMMGMMNGGNGFGGVPPGMGGPNAIAQRSMAVEQAIGEWAKTLPDPAPAMNILAQVQAASVAALQSSAAPQPPSAGGAGMAGIVAPPTPIAPPAMGGMGMPAPPLM